MDCPFLFHEIVAFFDVGKTDRVVLYDFKKSFHVAVMIDGCRHGGKQQRVLHRFTSLLVLIFYNARIFGASALLKRNTAVCGMRIRFLPDGTRHGMINARTMTEIRKNRYIAGKQWRISNGSLQSDGHP
jgi:hypothetical protein